MDSQPLQLTPVLPADFPTVIRLVNDAYRGWGAVKSWNTEVNLIAGPRLDDQSLPAMLAESPDGELLVHRDDMGTVIGTVWLEPQADRATWYLGLLCVEPALQQQHLGARILQAAERYAAARGATRIRMTVVEARTTLVAWYMRRGYHDTGEREPYPVDGSHTGRPLVKGLQFMKLERMLSSPGVTSS